MRCLPLDSRLVKTSNSIRWFTFAEGGCNAKGYCYDYHSYNNQPAAVWFNNYGQVLTRHWYNKGKVL